MNHGRPGYAATGRGHPSYRGRSSRSADSYAYRPRRAGGEGPSLTGSSSPSGGDFRGRSSHQMASRNFRTHYVQKQAFSSEQWQWRPSNNGKNASPGAVNLQQEHNLNSADDVGNASEQEQLLGSMESNSDSNELSPSSAQNVSENLHSAVERIQIQEPTTEGESPHDNRNRLDAVDQELMVQVPLESCAKEESSSIKSSENNVSGAVNFQQEHNLNSADVVGNASEQEQLLGSMESNSDSHELLPSSAHNVSENLHSAVERIQIREPTTEGESPHDNCNRLDAVDQELMVQVPLESCAKEESSSIKSSENNVSNCKGSGENKPSVNLDTFDIAPQKSGVTLNPSLLSKNREKKNELKRAREGTIGIMLRPGMILLKSGISFRDQVNIVKRCRNLGIDAGGFYQPGYREGGKLHLKMMCLGKNWDPDTSTYGDVRPFDNTKPPGIPIEFHQLVEKAIKDSYAIMEKNSTTKNSELVLPWMEPNICIVNFYSQNGRLGLHQDRDESRESLDKGLPVVSFSIGDSAEFLYGDRSNVDQAEKVTLESGDILIFGGKSRLVFHGVTEIHPNTAPKALLEESKLRPGRLNLTFRQY